MNDTAHARPDTKKVSVALVGYGYWGPNIARCIKTCEIGLLSAICEGSPDRRNAARLEHPDVPIVQLDDVLNDQRISAVILATPTETHADIALQCIRYGKHLLVEKPFTVRSSEAKLLVEESQRSGLVLMVDHTYVFSPCFQAIQELIATRELGALRYYHANRLNCFGPAHDTNVLWDLAVHDLAMLDLLMPSPPASMQAVGLSWPNDQAASHAQLLLAYPDRGIASVLVSWVAPKKVRTVLLGFDQHTIIWDDLAGGSALQLFDRGVEPLSSAKLQLRKEAEVIQVAPSEPLSQVIYHFLECVSGRNQPRTDGSAGLRTVRILEIAGQAIARSGLPIVVEPGDIAA